METGTDSDDHNDLVIKMFISQAFYLFFPSPSVKMPKCTFY